jgi:8-oxo-dGTP pyrophosphatase MutT (NUDIX family)
MGDPGLGTLESVGAAQEDEPVGSLPAWLEPVRSSLDGLEPGDLTRTVPPPDLATRKSAVLILFGESPEGPDILLTERAHDMRTHPGQVSFPGGSSDPGETPDQTALREAEEETGLDPAGVDLFGHLPELWLPPSNHAVTPVLGYWRAVSPVQAVDPREVHAIHRVTIDYLLDPEHRVSVHHPSGFVGPAFLIGPQQDLILWGFTAGILSRLFDYIGWTRPWDESRRTELPEYMTQWSQRSAEERR